MWVDAECRFGSGGLDSWKSTRENREIWDVSIWRTKYLLVEEHESPESSPNFLNFGGYVYSKLEASLMGSKLCLRWKLKAKHSLQRMLILGIKIIWFQESKCFCSVNRQLIDGGSKWHQSDSASIFFLLQRWSLCCFGEKALTQVWTWMHLFVFDEFPGLFVFSECTDMILIQLGRPKRAFWATKTTIFSRNCKVRNCKVIPFVQ